MNSFLRALVILSVLGSTVSLNGSSPSAFQPVVSEHMTYICFNIGSKYETIGPFQAETAAISYPVGVQLPKELPKIKSKHVTKRAFQVGRFSPNGMQLHVQVDPVYHYDVELGFVDYGSACRLGGTSMDIFVGDGQFQQRKTDQNPSKSVGCLKPFFVRFQNVKVDLWNKIRINIVARPGVFLTTACFEKRLSALSSTTGYLYMAADQQAELFINGKSFLKISQCYELTTVKVALKYDDVIAIKATNINLQANLRVAFVSNGRQLFGTGDAGWKVRNAFLPPNGENNWMLPKYVDNDWPNAKIVSHGCTVRNFPTDAKLIWTDDGKVPETVFFRYVVRQ